jgi:hypothetical protein
MAMKILTVVLHIITFWTNILPLPSRQKCKAVQIFVHPYPTTQSHNPESHDVVT